MWFHLGLSTRRIAIQMSCRLLLPHVVWYRAQALGWRLMVFELEAVADDPLPVRGPRHADWGLHDAVGHLRVPLQIGRGLYLGTFPRPPVVLEISGFSRLLDDGWLDMLAISCSSASFSWTSPFWRCSLSVGR